MLLALILSTPGMEQRFVPIAGTLVSRGLTVLVALVADDLSIALLTLGLVDVSGAFLAPCDLLRDLTCAAIDARDCRSLAEFYRRLLGLRYRDGEEPPTDGSPDDADWLVLLDDLGRRIVTIQQKRTTTAPTWPDERVPMQMHMDFAVPSVEELERHRARAQQLGARVLHDRSHDEGEPLYVLADPAGHPFCLLVQQWPGTPQVAGPGSVGPGHEPDPPG